jgi:predicted secreted Zn-dependent protease
MSQPAAALWLAASSVVSCAAAHAEVAINDTLQSYRITGASEAELRREMNAKGPLAPGGRRFDGYTRWEINWRYTYRESGGMCRIQTVATAVKIVMTLPQWDDERSASNGLRTRWHQFITALTAHENGHRAHGMDAGREIDRAIAALPPQANCAAAGAAANHLGNEIIHKYNELDFDYDRKTGHGLAQGTRFP